MNGDKRERWRAYWRRVLPGASEEEIERRVREALTTPGRIERTFPFRAWGERVRERAGGSPAEPLFGQTLEDSFSKWRRWLQQAAAWMKRFEKEPPWQKIGQSGALKRWW